MATASEDLTASDAIEESEPKLSKDLNCTLCMKVFKSPRRLPCLHSFCHDCLQSHISHNTTVKGTNKEFCCPICEAVVQSGEKIALDKWVYLFPHNTLLLSVLMKLKVKVDLVCDVCQTQNVQYPAKELCIVCEQALCQNCSKMHGNLRLLSTHDILKVEELSSKQTIVLENSSMFKCVEHTQIPLEYYCKTHEIHLCTICFVSYHKRCSEIVELANKNSNPSDTLNNIKVQLKGCADQLKKTIDIKMSNLRKLESQINYLTSEIQALKKSINKVLDDLERMVKDECGKIYDEERKKFEQLNLGCQSKIMSIKNSNCIIESVSKCATQSQMFLLIKGMSRQLSLCKTHIDNKYTQNDTVAFKLEINPQLKSIASIPREEIAKITMTRNDENPVIIGGSKPLQRYKVEAVDVRKIKVCGNTITWYTDARYVSHDNVMVVDYNNKKCHLLDSLFNCVCIYSFSGSPWQLCALDQSEIAVSIPENQTIQFLSVRWKAITRKIKTRQQCYGIASVSKDEMIISGPCDDHKKFYWSLITLDGKEKSYHEFPAEGKCQTYVSLNALKCYFYIAVYQEKSLHCFGLDGKKYFTFKHRDLNGPQTVAIDRDGNVYAVGCDSRNIFQLSADGVLIQIITDVVPKNPMTMCFNEDGNRFLLTCWKKAKLHVFRLVLTKD